MVANLPLCWPVFRLVTRGSAWGSNGRSSKAQEVYVPGNQPRTGRFDSKPRTASWMDARGGHTWNEVGDDAENWSTQSKEPIVRCGEALEDSDGNIELKVTPSWQHDANSSTVTAEYGTGASGGSGRVSRGSSNREALQVKIVTTVDVSHERLSKDS